MQSIKGKGTKGYTSNWKAKRTGPALSYLSPPVKIWTPRKGNKINEHDFSPKNCHSCSELSSTLIMY